MSLVLQAAASVCTIAGTWAYGRKLTIGPFIGLVAQVPWWGLMIYSGLWGLLPVNIVMTWLHWRNLKAWRREARDDVRTRQP